MAFILVTGTPQSTDLKPGLQQRQVSQWLNFNEINQAQTWRRLILRIKFETIGEALGRISARAGEGWT
jgi:hypothetical protein